MNDFGQIYHMFFAGHDAELKNRVHFIFYLSKSNMLKNVPPPRFREADCEPFLDTKVCSLTGHFVKWHSTSFHIQTNIMTQMTFPPKKKLCQGVPSRPGKPTVKTF